MECTGWGIGGGQGVVSGVHRVGYRRGAGCGEVECIEWGDFKL